MEETAYAKINLALHVRAREPDGYHRIETLFAFAEEGDQLRVADSEELGLEVTGPFAEALADEGNNLVLQAAEALRASVSGTKGAALVLDKRLPVASGLGGGSADAAAVLRLLTRWWNLDLGEEALVNLARPLGADVPACVWSRTCRGEARGDRLSPVKGSELSGIPLLIVNPLVPVPTGPVFAGWDGVDRGSLVSPFEGRNDLQGPAIALAPVIQEVLARLSEGRGTLLSRMSGSGASCFALYDSEGARDEALEAIAACHPAWWTLATRLR